MTGTATIRYLGAYRERVQRPRFFSSPMFFQTPPNAVHNADTVEYDIIRQGQKIAVPVPDAKAGARRIEVKKSVNKGWAPIVYKYESSVNAAELTRRFPGKTPYDDVQMAAAASELAMDQIDTIQTWIRDAIEVHCAELMQTGTITPKDENNDTVGEAYNFFPLDATGTLASGDLIITSGVTAWAADGATGNPLGDLGTLGENMRKRGYNPVGCAFGTTAWQRFLANTTVKERYNLLNANFGTLAAASDPTGATRQGRINIGDYLFELWTYGGMYEKPYGAAMTPYLDAGNVVMWAEGRRIMTFGGISRFEQAANQQALAFLPRRMSFPELGFDISLFAYFTPDAENLVLCAGTRVLPVPISIDSFACITVT
jgi:hypothetical protein